MGKPRRMQERRNLAWLFAGAVLKPVLLLLTRPRWVDCTNIPAHGGAVIAANHVSHVDPLTFAHLVWDHGRLPRFLAKAGLFDVKAVGWLLRATGQIPVYRMSADASRAFTAAVKAVQDGKLVIVYPEGTITRDPDLWPMRGRSGAARIALAAGVPVIPIAHWGAHDLLYPYAKRPHLFPPTVINAKAGTPVDLDDLQGKPMNHQVVDEATDRIMADITALLEEIRGEQAPAERFDPRAAGMREIGNPNDPQQHPHQRRRRGRRRSA